MRSAYTLTHRLLAVAGLLAAGGCTAESTRIALDAQRRADQVQKTVFDHQHEGLCMLLYRDLRRQLEAGEAELSEDQLAALNRAWNDRDLFEFWALQDERARALRLVGVDAKLAADQSPVDLLIKAAQAKGARVKQGLAAWQGTKSAEQPVEAAAGE